MKKLLKRCVLLLVVFAYGNNAFAFNSLTHEQITRSALSYLNTHSHVFPETEKWLGALGPDYEFMTSSLVRAVVDADYRTDLWMSGLFHKPFVGGADDGHLAVFTALFHFMNVTESGRFWQYDGYSYLRSS